MRAADSMRRMINNSMQTAFLDAMLEGERRARQERKRAHQIEDATKNRQPLGTGKAPDSSQTSDSEATTSEATESGATGSGVMGIAAGAIAG